MCKECHREYYSSPKWKAYNKEYNAKRMQGNLRWLREYKANLSCDLCGETHPACLDFHHKNGTEKKFLISRASCASRKQILEEIAKCEILCANCHRKLHSGEET